MTAGVDTTPLSRTADAAQGQEAQSAVSLPGVASRRPTVSGAEASVEKQNEASDYREGGTGLESRPQLKADDVVYQQQQRRHGGNDRQEGRLKSKLPFLPTTSPAYTKNHGSQPGGTRRASVGMHQISNDLDEESCAVILTLRRLIGEETKLAKRYKYLSLTLAALNFLVFSGVTGGSYGAHASVVTGMDATFCVFQLASISLALWSAKWYRMLQLSILMSVVALYFIGRLVWAIISVSLIHEGAAWFSSFTTYSASTLNVLYIILIIAFSLLVLTACSSAFCGYQATRLLASGFYRFAQAPLQHRNKSPEGGTSVGPRMLFQSGFQNSPLARTPAHYSRPMRRDLSSGYPSGGGHFGGGHHPAHQSPSTSMTPAMMRAMAMAPMSNGHWGPRSQVQQQMGRTMVGYDGRGIGGAPMMGMNGWPSSMPGSYVANGSPIHPRGPAGLYPSGLSNPGLLMSRLSNSYYGNGAVGTPPGQQQQYRPPHSSSPYRQQHYPHHPSYQHQHRYVGGVGNEHDGLGNTFGHSDYDGGGYGGSAFASNTTKPVGLSSSAVRAEEFGGGLNHIGSNSIYSSPQRGRPAVPPAYEDETFANRYIPADHPQYYAAIQQNRSGNVIVQGGGGAKDMIGAPGGSQGGLGYLESRKFQGSACHGSVPTLRDTDEPTVSSIDRSLTVVDANAAITVSHPPCDSANGSSIHFAADFGSDVSETSFVGNEVKENLKPVNVSRVSLNRKATKGPSDYAVSASFQDVLSMGGSDDLYLSHLGEKVPAPLTAIFPETSMLDDSESAKSSPLTTRHSHSRLPSANSSATATQAAAAAGKSRLLGVGFPSHRASAQSRPEAVFISSGCASSPSVEEAGHETVSSTQATSSSRGRRLSDGDSTSLLTDSRQDEYTAVPMSHRRGQSEVSDGVTFRSKALIMAVESILEDFNEPSTPATIDAPKALDHQ